MSQIVPVETRQNRRILLIVSALTVCLFASSNLPWTLDDYDQAKQAFVSFQMIGQQRWLYQTTPAEGKEAPGGRHSSFHISTKPPAVAWASAALFAITRSWDFAWRFPSFLAALALAFLIFRAARAFGELPALIALAAFGLNQLSVRLATLVRTDMPLALVSFAIGLLMFEKIRTRTRWNVRDRVTLFVLLTAAMFIKGPIVWAFVLPPLVFYQLRRKWRSDFSSAWSGWIPWVASCAIFGLWVIFGIRFIDGFYEDVVLTEFLGRFHEGIHRSQPLLFYIPHLLHKFAPWGLLILGLLVVALRKTKAATGKWLAEISPETFWLIAWALGGIVVMSLIPSKRVDRIFPAIPPLCLLLAAQIRAMTAGNSIRIRRVAMFAVAFAAIFISAYSAFRVIDGYRKDRDALVKFGREVRRIAAAEHLRIEVLPALDEGLLLYLRRPRFFTLNSNGESCAGCDHGFDGLVVPLDEKPWDSNQFQYRLTVEKKGDYPTSYGFLAPWPPHR
jgi:4-amino-4-deoxy-L-arabinose transferase-like glycosyltransferase